MRGTTQHDRGVAVELRAERVAEDRHRVRAIVHFFNPARVAGLAQHGRHEGSIGRGFAEGEPDGGRDGEGAGFAGVEADQDIGEDGGVQPGAAGADPDDARFPLALKSIEGCERQGVVHSVAEVRIVDDAERRSALSELHQVSWVSAWRKRPAVSWLRGFADSLAVALGGRGRPVGGVAGGQQFAELEESGHAEIESHVEERGLHAGGVGIPFGQGRGHLCGEAIHVGGGKGGDRGVGHAALRQRCVAGCHKPLGRRRDAGVVGTDLIGRGARPPTTHVRAVAASADGIACPIPIVTSPPVQRYMCGTRPSNFSRRVTTEAASMTENTNLSYARTARKPDTNMTISRSGHDRRRVQSGVA